MTLTEPFPESIQLLTAIWNLWQSLFADGAARLREDCGLDLKEFIAVCHLQAPAHPADLAQTLQMPRYEVSRLLKSLEEKGFVQRSRQQADGRQILVELTPNGLEAWQAGMQTVQHVTEPYLAHLNSTQRQELIQTLFSLNPKGASYDSVQ